MFTAINGVLGRAAMGLAAVLVAVLSPLANAADAPVAPVAAGKATKPAVTPLKEVKLTVKVIHAGRRGNTIDTRIRDIEKLVKPVFKFTSYRLVKEEKLTLAFKKETRLPLPFRAPVVHVTQGGRVDRKIRLTLRSGSGNAIKLQIEEGGTFLHGITLKNGQSFILAFSAKVQ